MSICAVACARTVSDSNWRCAACSVDQQSLGSGCGAGFILPAYVAKIPVQYLPAQPVTVPLNVNVLEVVSLPITLSTLSVVLIFGVSGTGTLAPVQYTL